jgi:hypothetical protein
MDNFLKSEYNDGIKTVIGIYDPNPDLVKSQLNRFCEKNQRKKKKILKRIMKKNLKTKKKI